MGGQSTLRLEIGRRLDHLAHTSPVRRRNARERVAPVDGFQQRRLFAVQVFLRTFEHLDLDAVEPSRALDLVDRLAEAIDFNRERLLGRDDDLVGVDGAGRDQRALENLIRIVAEDRPVLERPRFTLGRVDHDRGALELGAVVAHRPPFASGRESGATEMMSSALRSRAAERPVPPLAFSYSSSEPMGVGYSTRCTSVMRRSYPVDRA